MAAYSMRLINRPGKYEQYDNSEKEFLCTLY